MRKMTATIAVAVAAALLAATTARAQENRRLQLIVGVSAGGPVDTVTRMVADKLKDSLNQVVVVENRLGGGTQVSLEAARNAPPDGRLLTVATTGMVALKFVSKAYTLDPLKDFTHIIQLTTGPLLLVANVQQPYRNLSEFIAYARANPGMNFATAGGTLDLDILTLASMGNFKVTLIPYKGSAPQQVALIANEVGVALDAYLIAKPNIDAGRIRILGVGTPKRFPLHPDSPAIAEVVPGFEASTNWFGIVGPPGMAPELVARFNDAMAAIIKSPDIRKRLNDWGLDAVGGTPAEFRSLVTRDLERMGKAAALSGLQPQ